MLICPVWRFGYTSAPMCDFTVSQKFLKLSDLVHSKHSPKPSAYSLSAAARQLASSIRVRASPRKSRPV